MNLSKNTKLLCALCGKKATVKIWCYGQLPFCSHECFKELYEALYYLNHGFTMGVTSAEIILERIWGKLCQRKEQKNKK